MLLGHSYVHSRGQDQSAQVAPIFRRNQRLLLRPEPTNRFDRNAVEVTNRDHKRVGRVAREHSLACSALMRATGRLRFSVKAYFDHKEEEVVIKPSGQRYPGVRVVIRLEFFGDDVDMVSDLVDELGLDFTPADLSPHIHAIELE